MEELFSIEAFLALLSIHAGRQSFQCEMKKGDESSMLDNKSLSFAALVEITV